MKLDDFDRTIIMTVDRRYPYWGERTAQFLREKGIEPTPFLNGRGVEGIDCEAYSLRHEGDPPSSWCETRGKWAYRQILADALRDEVSTLLFSRSCDGSPDYKCRFEFA